MANFFVGPCEICSNGLEKGELIGLAEKTRWKVFALGTSGAETYFSCEAHRDDVIRKAMRSTGVPRERITIIPIEN